MHWNDRLSVLLRDHNLTRISERLGFAKNRMYAIVKDGQCPNAVDALKICWYLGVPVDDIFGDTAEEELAEARTEDPVKRPSARRQAAEKVLAETIEKRVRTRKGKPNPKRDSGRQTG